jgi:hypothetical protein
MSALPPKADITAAQKMPALCQQQTLAKCLFLVVAAVVAASSDHTICAMNCSGREFGETIPLRRRQP